jgi:archaellum component FlaC
MSLHEKEIRRLQDEIKNLQQLKSTFQSSYNTKMCTTQRLKLEIQKLQKEIVAAKTLVEAMEKI